jgi:hypothetical protein
MSDYHPYKLLLIHSFSRVAGGMHRKFARDKWGNGESGSILPCLS